MTREQWFEVLEVLAEHAKGADEVHRALVTILNSDAERIRRALQEKKTVMFVGRAGGPR